MLSYRQWTAFVHRYSSCPGGIGQCAMRWRLHHLWMYWGGMQIKWVIGCQVRKVEVIWSLTSLSKHFMWVLQGDSHLCSVTFAFLGTRTMVDILKQVGTEDDINTLFCEMYVQPFTLPYSRYTFQCCFPINFKYHLNPVCPKSHPTQNMFHSI